MKKDGKILLDEIAGKIKEMMDLKVEAIRVNSFLIQFNVIYLII